MSVKKHNSQVINEKSSTKEKVDFVYSGKAQTKITLEIPDDNNPYISQASYLHGYNLTELIDKKSFTDTLLLLFTGELPQAYQADLLNRLMVALINLGPRHQSVKAAMVAGVSKTNTEHLLPIGLSVLGGHSNGANEVANCVTFLINNIKKVPEAVAKGLIAEIENEELAKGEFHLCPGFGNQYGSIDTLANNLMEHVFTPLVNNDSLPSDYLSWAISFNQFLKPYNFGLLRTGLAAAVFCELGIAARESIGLFQLLCAPGIFAHGVEQTHKPITAMPMLNDEQHIYQPQVK